MNIDRALLHRKIGTIIRSRRIAAGLTQGELAELVSLSRVSIVNVETGHQRIPIYRWYEIHEAIRSVEDCDEH